ADWPNGSLYLWPIPTQANAIELELWTLLNKVLLTDTFSLPPGYEEALTLTLAEGLCPPFGRQVDPLLSSNAMKARAIIKSVNSAAPRMDLRDGIEGGANRAYFNYLTGNLE